MTLIMMNVTNIPDYWEEPPLDLEDEIDALHDVDLREIYDHALELSGTECDRIFDALKDIIKERKNAY